MKLIIDIPEEIYESQRYAQYFGAWSVVLQKHFENGTPIPDNATNGDVIKALFKPKWIRRMDDVIREEYEFDADWWHEPYQKGGNK